MPLVCAASEQDTLAEALEATFVVLAHGTSYLQQSGADRDSQEVT